MNRESKHDGKADDKLGPYLGIPYICIYRRFRGASPACPSPLDREIDFDINVDSFVRGEAKLRERVRGASLTLGLPVGSCAPRRVLSLKVLEQ